MKNANREPIKEPHKSIVNEEYQRAKRLLKPLLKGKNRSFIKIYWNDNLRSTGGTTRRNPDTIALNAKYRDQSHFRKWNEESFRHTLRHEFCHLVEFNHSPKFKQLLRQVEGSRFQGGKVYQGKGNSNK